MHKEKGPNYKIWVFFDEFNTTDELSYIKEIIVDRRFQGEPYPPNVVFLAACNPYRQAKQRKNTKVGLKIKTTKDKEESLAFKVKPPPLAMISLMWDYQQLARR